MFWSRFSPDYRMLYQVVVFLTAVLVAAVAGYLLLHYPRGAGEMAMEDTVARLVPAQPRNDIVIVDLDQASTSRYGPVKAWPRSLLATGLAKVERDRPRSVVMDLALTERTHTGDRDLWRGIANSRNVVLGMAYDAARDPDYTPDDIRSLVFLEKYAVTGGFSYDPARMPSFLYRLFEPPVSDFTGSSRGVGVFVRETDPDGVLRSARLIYRTVVDYPQASAPLPGRFPESKLAYGVPVALPDLALVAALRSFDLDKDDISLNGGHNMILTGNLTPPVDVPIDDQGRMEIRFAGPAGTFAHVSFVDLVNGAVTEGAFRDKTVIFGATAPHDAATDPTLTPFGTMPRVEVTANGIATLLGRSYFGRYPSTVMAPILLVGLVVGIIMMFAYGWRSVGTAALLLVGYLAAACGAVVFGHVMLPILPGAAIVLCTLLMSLMLYTAMVRSLGPEPSSVYLTAEPGDPHIVAPTEIIDVDKDSDPPI